MCVIVWVCLGVYIGFSSCVCSFVCLCVWVRVCVCVCECVLRYLLENNGVYVFVRVFVCLIVLFYFL